jgi:hypothetical protein
MGSDMTDDTPVHVRLLGEGVPVSRPVPAVRLSDNRYRLEATVGYSPEDETWEFVPGTVVRCELTSMNGDSVLLAVQRADESPPV